MEDSLQIKLSPNQAGV